jgi:hypothetical protein
MARQTSPPRRLATTNRTAYPHHPQPLTERHCGHTATALDPATNTPVSSIRIDASIAGYRQLIRWAAQFEERRWAIENAKGLGSHLTQWLIARDEAVVDVATTATSRVRELSRGGRRKNDVIDASAAASVAALHGDATVATADDETTVFALLEERRANLAAQRVRTVNQLHALMRDLTAGGARVALSANVAAAKLRSVRAGHIWRRIDRVQPVVATPACWSNRRGRCSSRASAGVFQPRIFRGLLLSASWTARSSSRPQRERSVPFGKYWRSSPLVFSFVARCHGECGSAKKTLMPVSIVNCAWADSSLPRSQVSERTSPAGMNPMVDSRASFMAVGAVAAEGRTVLDGRLDAVALESGQVDEQRCSGRCVPRQCRSQSGAGR